MLSTYLHVAWSIVGFLSFFLSFYTLKAEWPKICEKQRLPFIQHPIICNRSTLREPSRIDYPPTPTHAQQWWFQILFVDKKSDTMYSVPNHPRLSSIWQTFSHDARTHADWKWEILWFWARCSNYLVTETPVQGRGQVLGFFSLNHTLTLSLVENVRRNWSILQLYI
jgi:hypothetical protein